jgi:hypothetical protein
MFNKKIFQILNTFISSFKKISVITQITITYSTVCTILVITLRKMLINYTPLIRLLSQTSFLLIFTHLSSFTIEDICNIYNNSLMEETKTLLMEETKTLLMEL